MEHAPYSTAGLNPEQLEKETVLVEKGIENVKEIIKQIDYKVIDDTLLDIFQKVYPEFPRDKLTQMFSFDGKYDITVKFTQDLDLGHYGNKGKIGTPMAYASGDSIVVFAREFVDDDGMLDEHTRSGLVRTVIHEIAHTKSYFREADGFDVSGINLPYSTENGNAFANLNEALTEVIADGIYSEYLARTGTAAEYDVFTADGAKVPIQRHAVYLNERLALEKLVSLIAEESGLPSDKVYESLIVEYFKNQDLNRSEVLSEIDSEELKLFLGKIEHNDAKILTSFSSQEIRGYENYMHWQQLQAVERIAGRDYIHDVNQQRHEEALAKQPSPTALQQLWEFLKNNF